MVSGTAAAFEMAYANYPYRRQQYLWKEFGNISFTVTSYVLNFASTLAVSVTMPVLNRHFAV